MNKKYEMIPDEETGLYRIKALRDIPWITEGRSVHTGDIGGFVETEKNLSHEGSCWIFDNARAIGYSKIKDDARILHDAIVEGQSTVNGHSIIMNKAHIYHSSIVTNSRITGNVQTTGLSTISSCNIHENVKIKNAYVRDAKIYGDTIISSGTKIICGTIFQTPTIEELLFFSLGMYPVNGKVRLFKRVNADMSSQYSPKFIYPEKGIVEVKDYEPDATQSCAKGLHFSTYGCYPLDVSGSKILVADIDVKDIICVLEGKVRCKKAKILGVVKQCADLPLKNLA
jgi:carbonic anhydrase/acetyltransferase-like protein (isoleucine patch superfamily)